MGRASKSQSNDIRDPQVLSGEAHRRAESGAGYLEMPIRDLLAIWGHRVRNHDTVAEIRAELATMGLATDPPFDTGPSSTKVRVFPLGHIEGPPEGESQEGAPALDGHGQDGPRATTQDDESSDPGADVPVNDESGAVFPQVSLRVRDLPSSTGGVCSVSPQDTLERARALMMRAGYSQLPVLVDARTMRGAVSWRSIACSAARDGSPTLGEVTDPHPEVIHVDDDLLRMLPRIINAEFAFVRHVDDTICGVVTTADLSTRFEHLTGPYFMIGEIEGRLRRRVDTCLSLDEIRTANRKANGAGDLMFGQYLALFSREEYWQKLGWAVDREIFIQDLRGVSRIRNRVMHFDENLPTAEEVERLQRFVSWLRQLDPHP